MVKGKADEKSAFFCFKCTIQFMCGGGFEAINIGLKLFCKKTE